MPNGKKLERLARFYLRRASPHCEPASRWWTQSPTEWSLKNIQPVPFLLLFWRQNENTTRITRNFKPLFFNKTCSIQYFFSRLRLNALHRRYRGFQRRMLEHKRSFGAYIASSVSVASLISSLSFFAVWATFVLSLYPAMRITVLKSPIASSDMRASKKTSV